MANLLRRQSLGLIAAASLPSTAVVAVAATSTETPSEKVARLGEELAHALNDHAGGKFHAVVYPSAQYESPVFFLSSRPLTAQQRFDHHLAELKKAAEELDPQIGYWHSAASPDGDYTCSVIITAFRVTGRYEGDGIYETGKEEWNGKRSRYNVRLRDDLRSGERSFDVWNSMDRLTLTESRLRTYVGRRLGDLPEGV